MKGVLICPYTRDRVASPACDFKLIVELLGLARKVVERATGSTTAAANPTGFEQLTQDKFCDSKNTRIGHYCMKDVSTNELSLVSQSQKSNN